MNVRTLTAILALLWALLVGLAFWVWASTSILHWSIPVLAVVVPLLAVAAYFGVQWLRSKRAAAQLEKALADDGAREEARATVSEAELARLRREFEQAVSALKSSKLATGAGSASAALYKLPWYTIIGPPASGKTTALRASGLKFPYLPGTGDRLKGIGGTRNCDWWLTNHAILLDTAGRWTTEEEDRDEWLTFLDLLKRHRRQRPLNGVIAAVSIAGDPESSIVEADFDGLRRLAGRMRERIDEIVGRLGVSLPVYLVFTKCDLLSGFVETFGELTGSERKQVWGFTAPLLSGPRRDPGPYFGEQLDLLRTSLEQHVLERMSDETDARLVPRLYEFPAQLGALKEKLTLFVDELFDDSAYGETPLLRGVYFTSGTQESTPADLLYEELADALNVRPQVTEILEVETKSYFLHDLLMRVIFADRELAVESQTALKRDRTRRRAVTTTLLVASALIAGIGALTWQQTTRALATTENTVIEATGGATPLATATVPERQIGLAAVGEDLARYQASAPLLTAPGLDVRERIAPPLRRYYGQALKEWIARPLINRSNALLSSFAQQAEAQPTTPTLDEEAEAELLGALKLHLLLSFPREECVPLPSARHDWTVSRLASLWERAAPVRDRSESQQRQQLLNSYLVIARNNADNAFFGVDPRSVRLARRSLTGEDGSGRIVNGLLDRFDGEQRTLSGMAGASTVLESTRSVRGAFTREAWREISRLLNEEDGLGDDEDWVFGCGREHVASVRRTQRQELFQRKYLERYEEQWRNFLGGIAARRPSNWVEAETMLSELSSRPGVLGNLFARVKEQTSLAPLKSKQSELTDLTAAAAQAAAATASNERTRAVADAVKQPAKEQLAPTASAGPMFQQLERTFKDFETFGVASKEGAEAPLEQARHQIETVLLALKTYRADDTKLDELALATRSAIDNVDIVLRGHAGSFGAQLRQLLLPPLEGVAAMALRERALRVERLYCDIVYRPFQEELGGRYPMRPDSSQMASLVSFQRFFQPTSGTFWSFQTTYLNSYTVREGKTFRFGGPDGGNARTLFRDELLGLLNHAARISRSFFPGEAGTMRVPFRLRVRGAAGYSLTSFRVGSTNVRYDSGIESWVSAEWPGEQASSGASISVVPYNGVGPQPLVADGEWGLFRIFDARLGGRVLERTSRLITGGWRPKADLQFIKVDFAADDPNSPLYSVPFGHSHDGLLPLVLPSHIAHGGPGCQG